MQTQGMQEWGLRIFVQISRVQFRENLELEFRVYGKRARTSVRARPSHRDPLSGLDPVIPSRMQLVWVLLTFAALIGNACFRPPLFSE